MEEIYVNHDELNEIISERGKGIFVFGSGVDAEDLSAEVNVDTDIIAFVDNKRSGEGNQYLGKDIISVKRFLKIKEDDQPIIIASYRYAGEISIQMKGEGLIAGKDYFIWDDWMLFHYNETVRNYVTFLKKVWAPYKRERRENKILIAFDNKCDLFHIKNAYYANYLAEKYDASIHAYFWFGSDASNAAPVTKEIFSAINMEELIDTTLLSEEQKEAEQILNQIWNRLETWEDWVNISVYGIHFGITIIRNFLRSYLPSFDLKNERMYLFLKQAINTIVFWKHYFERNHVVTVLCGDGVSWEGYIRDIAVSQGIPAYEIGCEQLRRLELNYFTQKHCFYYKEMWNQLTDREKEIGIEWARAHVNQRIQGKPGKEFFVGRGTYSFSQKIKEERILNDNDKLKLVICPHIFEEDCYHYGEQIFDNNYFAWLCHLGELSDRTPEYDWYLKMHPHSSKRDFVIMDMLLKRYPRIHRLPDDVSPLQMKQEGMKFALTVCGTIGQEYPAIGIQVINAGNNPYDNFNFTYNPKTKAEYDDLIMHLNELEPKSDEMGLLQFYSMNYLIYDKKQTYFDDLFFKKEYLGLFRESLLHIGKRPGIWLYQEYVDDWTEERHEQAYSQMEQAFQRADSWRPDILYKRDEFLELCRENPQQKR